MGFITHYRGHLHDYEAAFDETMILHEVTLDEYLAEQFPPILLEKYPEQMREESESERSEILASTKPGDTLWLWRRVDPSSYTDGSVMEWGGLAVKRGGKVVRVWLVWRGV